MPRMALAVMLWALLPALSSAVAAEPPAKRVLLLWQGPDGHPPQTHEYEAGMSVLAECLRDIEGLEVVQARAEGMWPEGPDLIRRSDGVVLFLAEGAKWIHEDPRRLEALGQLAGRGGGFVALHWAMGTKEGSYIEGFLELFGGCHGGPDRKYQVLKTTLTVASPEHPILRGIGPVEVRDEFYYDLKFVDGTHRIQPLLTAHIDGRDETVAWAWQRGDGGRSFGFSGLHFHRNWEQPTYRRLVTQGVLWTLKLPQR